MRNSGSERLLTKKSALARHKVPIGIAAGTAVAFTEGPTILNGLGHIGDGVGHIGSALGGGIGHAASALGAVAGVGQGPVSVALASGLGAGAVLCSGLGYMSTAPDSDSSLTWGATTAATVGLGVGIPLTMALDNPGFLIAGLGAGAVTAYFGGLAGMARGYQLPATTRRVITDQAAKYGASVMLGTAAALGLEALTGAHGTLPAVTEAALMSAAGLTALPLGQAIRSHRQANRGRTLDRG